MPRNAQECPPTQHVRCSLTPEMTAGGVLLTVGALHDPGAGCSIEGPDGPGALRTPGESRPLEDPPKLLGGCASSYGCGATAYCPARDGAGLVFVPLALAPTCDYVGLPGGEEGAFFGAARDFADREADYTSAKLWGARLFPQRDDAHAFYLFESTAMARGGPHVVVAGVWSRFFPIGVVSSLTTYCHFFTLLFFCITFATLFYHLFACSTY